MKQNIDLYNGYYSHGRLLFYTLCLANITSAITLLLPAAMLPLLIEHTHIPLEMAGWIFASLSIGILLSATIQGAFSKWINLKYLLLGSMMIIATVGLAVPWTHAFSILLMAQFLLGMAFGFFYVTLIRLAARAFLETLSETLNKLQVAFGLGALTGPLLLSFALQILHNPIWASCALSILACITIFFLIPLDIPPAIESEISQKAEPSMHIYKQTVFWLAISQAFLYMAAEVGFENWIVTVVSRETAVTLAIAAPVDTLFWIGLTLGNVLSAQILQRDILSERSLLYCCILGGGLSGLLVIFFSSSLWTSFAASLLMGLFFGPILPSIIAIASRHFVEQLDFVSSALSFGCETGGLLCPLLMGLVIARFGDNWGMLLPVLLCLLIIVPFSLAWWQTRENHQTAKGSTFSPDDLLWNQIGISERVMSGSLE